MRAYHFFMKFVRGFAIGFCCAVAVALVVAVFVLTAYFAFFA